MGNINDLWYLKSAGGSWADTKCSLDDCYSIPFDTLTDDSLFLQVDVPLADVIINKIWIADLNGFRVENIMAITGWKIITGNGMYRLIFKVRSTKACKEYMSGKKLNCFRFEVPLMSSGSPSVEVDTLISEPFHCPQCEDTVKISSDYCFSPTDIFGTFIFNPEGMGTEQFGGLNEAKNDFRIQAKMKQVPSQVKASRNLRCFNYSTKLQQRFKLQGYMTDFPDYMLNIIESIFSGKHIYIDGEEYVISGETIFTERNVTGRTMKQLEVDLVKCELERVHRCQCVVNCAEHPVGFTPSAITITLAAELGYTLDNTYWYVEIDPSQIIGEPPFIYHWSVPTGNAAPNSDLIPFIDNRHYNIFRRTDLSAGTMHIQVLVTDSNGCTAENGNIKALPQMSCTGYDASFTIGATTSSSIEIASITPAIGPGVDFDISLDGGATFPIEDEFTLPYLISGLTPGTYHIVIRRKCYFHPGAYYSSLIGPMTVTI